MLIFTIGTEVRPEPSTKAHRVQGEPPIMAKARDERRRPAEGRAPGGLTKAPKDG
jgi:hypothetical protein